MPTQRQILDQLKRDELIAAVDRCELSVEDRRVRGQLIDALASARSARLPEILADLSRDRLKEICRGLGLDDGGRAKATIIFWNMIFTQALRKPARPLPFRRIPGEFDVSDLEIDIGEEAP